MRSDAGLQREVERQLKRDPRVDVRRVVAAVDNGVVTLTGEVSSYVAKCDVERAVERVAGVRGVANEIRVRTPRRYNDTDIAKVATNLLEWNFSPAGGRVMVEVEDGWVTLTGQFTHDDQRQGAEAIIRPLHGVKGINNLIKIVPWAPPEPIERPVAR